MPELTRGIIQKFNVSGPRYTSYPTAPCWTDSFNSKKYLKIVKDFLQQKPELSLYVHIPFCQQLCYFCGCTTSIRKRDRRYSAPYIKAIEKEVSVLLDQVKEKPKIAQFHMGGGTPNFLFPDEMRNFIKMIKRNFEFSPKSEVAIEIDPRTVDESYIDLLHELGFNRISFGVQDFDPDVQKNINRIQPFEMVENVVRWARERNFSSVNLDLIYGLPGQTLHKFEHTVKQIYQLRPDRIALYGYAHVPWLRGHQKKMDELKLPKPLDKLDLFLEARKKLIDFGYTAIAMDHFALDSDEMALAFKEKKLYRNFMGYTLRPAETLVGLGQSAISYVKGVFAQNQKDNKLYYKSLETNCLPVEKGMFLNKDDKIRQWVILEIMCHQGLEKRSFYEKFSISFDSYFESERIKIMQCVDDGLIEFDKDSIKLTPLGVLFARNVCMVFDKYYQRQKKEQRFSKTI